MVLLLNASKVAGVVGAITVVANALTFRHFHRKNLAPFPDPVDETQEVLASFPIDKDVEDGGFFFALATAPAHVEDKLDDAWLEFAKESEPKDNPAGDPPETRTGEKENAAEFSGVSLTEEAQAEDIKESSKKAGTEAMAVSGGNTVLSKEYPEAVQSTSGEKAPEDKVGLAGLGRSDTPDIIKVEEAAASTGKNGEGLGGEWEVLSEKDKSEEEADSKNPGKLEAAAQEFQKTFEDGQKQLSEEDRLESMRRRMASEGPKKPRSVGYQGQSVADPSLMNVPLRAKKFAKLSMEAMIRGFEKLTEEEESHNVAAWHNAIRPEERVRFWSDPDTELKLAQGTHSTVFRMGVDWSRIMPIEPVNGIENAVNWRAVDRYRYIIQRVIDHGMKVMLTLFHHSLPQWAAAYGGWKEAKTIKYFLDFTRLVVDNYGDLIDYWITFNEPHVFAMLTYCAGAWPGGDPDMLEQVTSAMPKGVFKVVMKAMADSHLEAYDIIHNSSKVKKPARVGISHHVSFMRPYGLFDTPLVVFSNWMTRFAYCDDVAHKCDFMGINYYGQEVISAPGLKNVENDEYSESGRGVYPDGLFRMLMMFHERYKQHKMKFIITENGVSDATDYIRRPYIIEHLLAVRAAMDKGVCVQGYCFWTISDNWEWADGYGPKFGLVAVDRHKNLARNPRPSYNLYSELSKTGKVTKKQRNGVWEDLQDQARQGKTRPFCRQTNSMGLMFAGGLDVPMDRPFAVRDWRFGKYEVEGLQDPISSSVRWVREGAFFRKKKNKQQQQKKEKTPSLTAA